jgi:SAM-dependent methyltransferase
MIKTWSSLASSYAQLIERYTLFRVLAKRLIALTPLDRARIIADVGAGTGLLSQELLQIVSDIELYALEPAPGMFNLLKNNIRSSHVRFYCMPAEAIATIPCRFDAVLSNATFHLVSLEQVLRGLSSTLNPGGKVIFNLWWHSFAETLSEDCSSLFHSTIEKLLSERGLTSPVPVRDLSPYTRLQIEQWAQQSHLSLKQVIIDRDSISVIFFLDFMRMYHDRPHPSLTPDERREFFEQAEQILEGQETTITSVRFLLE